MAKSNGKDTETEIRRGPVVDRPRLQVYQANAAAIVQNGPRCRIEFGRFTGKKVVVVAIVEMETWAARELGNDLIGELPE